MKKRPQWMNDAIIKSFPSFFVDDSIERVKGMLLEFYKDLGWNPKKQSLNVKKIYISQKSYTQMHDYFKSFPGINQAELSTLMLHYGPSVKDDVFDSDIVLLDGAITDDIFKA